MVAIAALVLPIVSHAKESKLSEVKERLIYSRAFEITLWASPVLAVYCQAEAGTRDLGAGDRAISHLYEEVINVGMVSAVHYH